MENDTSQKENLESLTAKCLIKLEDGMKVKYLTSYITNNSNLYADQCGQLSELIEKFSESRDQVDQIRELERVRTQVKLSDITQQF